MSVILIGIDNQCFCTCASKCVLGKKGSATKCSNTEIDSAGYSTLRVSDAKSNNEIFKALTLDGKKHVLKIKDVKLK